MTRSRFFVGALLVVGLSVQACYDFHLSGPEDAPSPSVPRLVSVTIEYRQPAGCLPPNDRCSDLVVFFPGWLRPRGEFGLTLEPGTFIWKGTAVGVPVNFPPRDEPYEVRIYDPHLVASPTGGFTGDRLRVGGQFLTKIGSPGTPNEHALVYIDDNGVGRNPF